jgi:hypothetical protein
MKRILSFTLLFVSFITIYSCSEKKEGDWDDNI